MDPNLFFQKLFINKKIEPVVKENYKIYLRFIKRKELLIEKLKEYDIICDRNDTNFEYIREKITNKIEEFEKTIEYIYSKIHEEQMITFTSNLTTYLSKFELINYIENPVIVKKNIINNLNLFFASYDLIYKYNFYDEITKIIMLIFTEIYEYHKTIKTSIYNRIDSFIEELINEEFFSKNSSSDNNILKLKSIINLKVLENLEQNFFQDSFIIKFVNNKLIYCKTSDKKNIIFKKNIDICNYIDFKINSFFQKELILSQIDYYYKINLEKDINTHRKYQLESEYHFLKLINLQKDYDFVYMINLPDEFDFKKYLEKANYNYNIGYYCKMDDFKYYIENNFTNVSCEFTVEKIIKIFCQSNPKVNNLIICDFSVNTLPKKYVLNKINKYYMKKSFDEI